MQSYTENELEYYKENPQKINSSLDFNLLIALSAIDAENFSFIVDQTEDLIYAAYEVNNSIFKYINFSKVSIQFLEKVVHKNPNFIQYVYYPSYDIIKIALDSDLNSFQYVIKNANDTLLEYAISKNGLLLEFVPGTQQSENLVKIAINENVDAYEYAQIKTKETDILVVKKDKSKIPLITNYWEELINELIDFNPRLMTFFLDSDALTIDILKKAIKEEPKLYKALKNPSYEITLYSIIVEPSLLQDIPYNSTLLKDAVKKNGLVLKYIKNADIQTIQIAVNQTPHALEFVKTKKEYFVKYAFERHGLALKYINNHSYDECLYAVKKDYKAIQFVNEANMSKELQLLALDGGFEIISLITKPYDEEVVLKILKIDPSYIFSISNPTEQMFKTIFKIYGRLILFFENWNNVLTTTVIATALSNDGTLLEFVEHKLKLLILVALNQYPLAIKWVKDQDIEMAYLATKTDYRPFFYIDKNVFDDTLRLKVLHYDLAFFERKENSISYEDWLLIVEEQLKER